MSDEQRILFVDDEDNLLSGIRRTIGRKYAVDTASSGADAIRLMESTAPFAVVFSDMRMPEMDGIEFLRAARTLHPETVRVMLTGNADQQTAIDAVNDGQIFRFLTKPARIEQVTSVIDAALEQYRLVTAEKDLLQRTLTGSIKLLTEILGLVQPQAFRNASRVRAVVRTIAESIECHSLWQYEIAAMLAQVGCVALPTELVAKGFAGDALSDREQRMFDDHPAVGQRLLGNIPRLGPIAAIVGRQSEPTPLRNERTIPAGTSSEDLGIEVLRTALAYVTLVERGESHRNAVTILRCGSERFNEVLLEGLEAVDRKASETAVVAEPAIRELAAWKLRPGMVPVDDILATNGALLVPRDQEITDVAVARLRNCANGIGVVEPIRVYTRHTDATSGEGVTDVAA